MRVENAGLVRAHRGAYAVLYLRDLAPGFDQGMLEALQFGRHRVFGNGVLRHGVGGLTEAEDFCVGDASGDGDAPVNSFTRWLTLRHAGALGGSVPEGNRFLSAPVVCPTGYAASFRKLASRDRPCSVRMLSG